MRNSGPRSHLRLGVATLGFGIAGVLVGGMWLDDATASPDRRPIDTKPVPYSYPTNDRGMTYGLPIQATSIENEPDLIGAYGEDGTFGYVLKTDLYGDEPSTPEEALAQQAARGTETRFIPLYRDDGVTVIGRFAIHPPSTDSP